ncbi:type II toxin-antitoxin system HicA family toxin [Pelagerythrobacter marensis]|uniref:Type II toxin-antitoxin system HicA family toxin n=1 Tax=Pelagerythrobacter marensis TaxID=543877 RepID=A0ABZ2D201_9SPHN
MKRRDVIKKLKAAGFEMVEGGNHTKVMKNGRYVSAIGRHTEIAEPIVKAIEKQTGVSLR